MLAFPFSTSLFYITNKIDQAFASLLQPSEDSSPAATSVHRVSTTEKVRIKSLIEETRITAVNAASTSGHTANIQEFSDIETDDEDDDKSEDDEDDLEPSGSPSVSLGLSKIYKRSVEILGDSLVLDAVPQHQTRESNNEHEMDLS